MVNKKQTVNRISRTVLHVGSGLFIFGALLFAFTLGPLYECLGDDTCPSDFSAHQFIGGLVAWLMPLSFLAMVSGLVVHVATKPKKVNKP